MVLNELSFNGFRNLEKNHIIPSKDVNVIYGKNAQGKTNLLEAIWLFTGARSFRASKDADLVAFDADKAVISASFFAHERDQIAEIEIEKRRSVKLNEISTSFPKFVGNFNAVVFHPEHLSLVKSGPEERRRFLDNAYCQIRPSYVSIISHFNKILLQRNSLLKQMKKNRDIDKNLLYVWNDRLALYSAKVILARNAYINRISKVASDIYSGFAENENLSLHYHCTAEISRSEKDIYLNLKTLLDNSTEKDVAASFTTIGPHRDDLIICINGLNAKTFASQGQQRSSVLALKLAEASVLEEEIGEKPIALLDDVMSELDFERQEYVLNHIEGWQVFITCCDKSLISRMKKGKAFHVEKGCVTEKMEL